MKRNALYLCILLGLLHSCSKPNNPKPAPLPVRTGGSIGSGNLRDSTKVVPIDSACTLTPPLHRSYNSLNGYMYTNQPLFGYNAPRFNPLNSNEILYVLGDRLNNTTTMIKYNLVTKTKLALATNVWDQPDWSSKGWILFNHGNNTIWKIKDNGDSLTQLTTCFSFSAVWDKPGNRFAFSTDGGPSYIADENGNILDSMMLPVYHGTWSPDHSKISSQLTYGKPGYIDLTNKQKHEFSGYGANSITGLDWLPGSQTILWCSDIGSMYTTDIVTGNSRQLRKVCAKRTYLSPSVSPDGTKIIVQAFDKNAIVDTFFIESNLYVMDADGSNEHKVIID